MKFCVALLVLSFSVLAADPGESCRTLERRGKRTRSHGVLQEADRQAIARLLAPKGYGDSASYKGANDQFKVAVAQQPTNADLRVRWGRLFLERFNPPEAQTLFKEALEIQPKHAGATLGIALIASDGFDKQAVEFAEQALQLDPKLVEAQELLAKLALEDNNEAKAIEEADKAMKMSPMRSTRWPSGWRSILLEDKKTSEWEGRINAINPVYGDAWSLAGHILVLNRRYEEGIAAYKKALALDPDLQSARAQLGINLMRLGRREGSARAPGTGVQCRLSGFRHRQHADVDGQLQELPHLQDPQHHRPAPQKRSRIAAPVHRRRVEARDCHLRKEVQDEVSKAGPGGGVSRPCGFRGANARHARPRRARRNVRDSRRDGQPFRPTARVLSLGQHAVARIEPRLRSDGDESPGAALVHRRHGSS